MTFGERLIDLRIENGYAKRNDFAEKLGIPSTTLRNYETDVREPGHTFLKQISEIFNVSVDYLLGLTDEKEALTSFRLKTSEYEHINKYRDLDDHGKEMVDFTLEKEWERSVTNRKSEKVIVLKEDNDYLVPNAAHKLNPTEEQRKNADNIMTNDSEWD